MLEVGVDAVDVACVGFFVGCFFGFVFVTTAGASALQGDDEGTDHAGEFHEVFARLVAAFFIEEADVGGDGGEDD